jgi:hypothetical protein
MITKTTFVTILKVMLVMLISAFFLLFVASVALAEEISTATCQAYENAVWVPIGTPRPEGDQWELAENEMKNPIMCGAHVFGTNGHRMIYLYRLRKQEELGI